MSTSADYVSKPARPKTGVGQKTLQNMKKTSDQNSLCANTAKSSSSQTENLTRETLERFEKILNGPHAVVLCKFMDVVLSGYGKIDIDSELCFVKLTFEEKIKF